MEENATVAARKLATAAAGVSAAVALAAGLAHGFGKDDASTFGATHIALGHLLPVLVAVGTLVWLTALYAAAKTRSVGDLLWLVAAEVGLCLWGSFTAIHSLGFYIFARTDAVGAARAESHSPTLAKVFFALAIVTMLLGTAGCLVRAVRRHQVPVVAAVLVVLGTLAAFVAGPIGDFLLAVALGWSAVHLAGSRQSAGVASVPVRGAAG